MKYRSLAFILLSVGVTCSAQQISYLQAITTGDFVTIYYDLDSTLSGQLLHVDLFSSHDQYQQPLQYVRGDVGDHIKPGKMKKIEWGAKKELNQYRGELTFEVRARLTFSPITIVFPHHLANLQSDQIDTLVWKGGLADDSLQLNLLWENHKAVPIAVVPNTGHYEWNIPKKMRERRDYRLEISWWNKGKKYQTQSSQFSIKRKNTQ